jgi:hypothetical protein
MCGIQGVLLYTYTANCKDQCMVQAEEDEKEREADGEYQRTREEGDLSSAGAADTSCQ